MIGCVLIEQVYSLQRASGQPVVSMGCKEERTLWGDKWPDAGQGANVRARYGQQGGGHGGRQPLRSVLQRTCRIAACGKWMALTCGTRPPTRSVVGRRACAGKDNVRMLLEAHAVQILEVVATVQHAETGSSLEGGDATPTKRGPRGGSRDGALGGDTGGDGSGATEWAFRHGCRERDASSDTGCTLKRTRAGRTEPHQGSGVRSPAWR